MNEQTARRAAKWWANHLRGPVMHDNGDAFQSAFMTQAASSIRERAGSEEKAQAFEDALTELIAFNGRLGVDRLVLDFDYHPDQTLAAAIEKAGFRDGFMLLPCKTMMWIDGERIRVSNGYRAPIVELPQEGQTT